jgi:hypothetical protein
LISLCRSAWTHHLLPHQPLLPCRQHQRTKPATAVFTSVSIKAPLFISVVVAWAQRDSSRAGLNDSGIGLWASGRNESGLGGVASRQRSFWLVADAELIVYGATDPSARLTIGGEEVPLSSDGTFRIQVPFRDGEQLYPIEATAADGEQKRNITLNFERQTPDDNSNPASEARAEWF